MTACSTPQPEISVSGSPPPLRGPGNLLTPTELLGALRITKPVFRELVREGLPHYVVGGGQERKRRRFDLAKVLAWLEMRQATPRRGRPHATGCAR